MAQPIRWDNINGAGLSEASRPLESAQRSFLGAFNTLGDTFAQREAIDNANVANTKVNNTNAFLDAIGKYRSPEELRAAQAAGGALDQLRSQFGTQIDANAVRGAADARVAALQGQAQQEIAYNHMMTDERVAPILDQYKAALIAGDSQKAAALDAQYQQLGGRDLATLKAAADNRSQELVQRGRQSITFDSQQKKFADDLLTSSATRQHMATSDATNSRAVDAQVRQIDFNIDNTRKQQEAAQAAGRAAAAKNALKEAGNVYHKGIYDGSQAEELLQTMTKNNIGDNNEDRTNILRMVEKLRQDGVEVTGKDGKTVVLHDLPVAAIEAAVSSSRDAWWRAGWNTGYAKDAKTLLENNLQQIVNKGGKDTSPVLDDLSAFKQTMRNVMDNAPPQRMQVVKNPFEVKPKSGR
jgi:hypothetical protein